MAFPPNGGPPCQLDDRNLSTLRGALQQVTTHSESLISALTQCPDAVIACERPGPGATLHRLDPEALEHWLDEYRLGDLWGMGELGAYP